MRNIKMTDEYLNKVIKESITDVLKTYGIIPTMQQINIGNIITLDGDNFYKYAEEVWNILEYSYESIGGIKSYRNLNDFIKKHHIIEVIFDNDKILACATYRRVEGSLKMVAIGCDQTDNGKLALQQIIQHNILNADLHYWAEVSGAIEYYFKKHNGYPIPNILVSEILQVDDDQIIKSKTDNVHYDRPIGENGELFTKMIFGAKNDEIFKKAINEVENYGKFMNKVNTINENKNIYTVKQAIYIIENIYRAHEEDGFNELIPSWHQALVSSLNTLKNVEQRTETIEDYISYCEYLLSDMQILELHVLKLF